VFDARGQRIAFEAVDRRAPGAPGLELIRAGEAR
jgi:hypothetical protein